MILNYNNSCSVCITCCNRDVHLLEFALEIISLQTVPFYELIVSANGLPKNYFEKKPKYIYVCGKKIPINYCVYPHRKNPGFARNFGARHCKTEYIMFCDVDDVSFSFRLEIALKCIKEHKPDCFLHGQIWHFPHRSFCEKDFDLYRFGLNSTNNSKDTERKLKLALENPPLFMENQKIPKHVNFEKISNIKIRIYSEQAVGDLYTIKKAKLNVAYGHPIVKVDKLINNKYDETLKIGEDIEFLHRLKENGNKIMYSDLNLLVHRGIPYSTEEFISKKVKGHWQIDDDFRNEYLQNRLDKGLNIYHNFKYEPEEENFKPINPE